MRSVLNSSWVRKPLWTLACFSATCLTATSGWAARMGPFELRGDGFHVERLVNGGKAFANRVYVWENVPSQFEGWMFTQVKGGVEARIAARSPEGGELYIATVNPPGGEWAPVEGAQFSYNDKYTTTLHVYSARVAPDYLVSIPQSGWAGTLVLSPSLTTNKVEENGVVAAPAAIGVRTGGQVVAAEPSVGVVSAHEEKVLAKRESKAVRREMKREVAAQRHMIRAERAMGHRGGPVNRAGRPVKGRVLIHPTVRRP